MTAPRELVMTINLNALEHLGINLYSNIPAVLSEIVANAWDADAENVTVTIDKATETITIEDDGTGMDRDAVIDRFLTVGFKRRVVLGGKTAKGRSPMGRKGIGKLSIFSIAQIAKVYTIVNGQKTAFKMDREVIREAISGTGQNSYKPEELTDWPSGVKVGTCIVLSQISKSLSGMTVEGLKRRVSRRFAVIGPKNNFNVMVNGNVIGPEDRAYHNALQYLWTFGDQSEFVKLCRNLERPADDRTAAIKSALAAAGLSLTGWIGTVTKPDQLKGEDGENLNRLAVFMRGKMAQEDILDEFGQKEIYADYVIGELHCEQLDLDDESDIATSSRQALKQDDPRFEALRAIVRLELRNVAGRWSEWRRVDGAKAAASVPAVSEWLKNLTGDTKKKAERWIGRLNTIRANDDGDKRELLKASILAFESYRRKDDLDKLDTLQDESVAHILDIFNDINDLELSYYGQIVKLRLGVIKALQEKVAENDKELVIRDFIKKHLWLLDPSWERAKGSEHSETTVNNFLAENTEKLNAKEKKARVDLAYRTAVGKHIIIELKRASVSVHLDDLIKQVRTYRDGVKKIIDGTGQKGWPIEIICLLGKHPPEWFDAVGTGREGVIAGLKNVDARIVLYDELLANAQSAYADYLEEHIKVDKLWGVFEAIDDFTPPPTS
ncbi:MAG: ATP-binding protein [Alphaproteobacteria bacterium]|nr:ATP-binding protein [Alphaproteobacteria bacterium]MBU0799252.1 ATP-binding protein [Alphaproteobacteria bacterium]MBU0885559.1 ATP-binding protein [Alphaproteobacteria bacterium]MBU1812964.1 ATP-binding protein [Alphaproteobacteria bacterium]